MEAETSLVISILLILFAIYIFRKSRFLVSEDVCLGLGRDFVEEEKAIVIKSQGSHSGIGVKGKILGLIFFLVTVQSLHYFGSKKLAVLILSSSFVLIFARRYLKNRKEYSLKQKLEYHLPLLMERLVMTIEAGQDVISGLKLIVVADSSGKVSESPLTKLFAKVIRLTEQGVTFTQGLRDVSQETSVVSVKHAMIHLALAYEQGGELILPLRELSDATQLEYQEVIEEKIAKLPIKATLPLLLLFAGLILFFVTPPVLEVLSLTQGVSF